MSGNEKLHPLKLSADQITLRDIAIKQIGELLATLGRLDAITGEQADTEVIIDIRSDLNHGVDLLNRWFGTSPVEDNLPVVKR